MESRGTVRVAVVGCGQIADAHLKEIAKLPHADVVAVCDRQVELAERAALVFGIPRYYGDLAELIDAERPDVVNVTTPAATHFAVARQCLEADIPVYVEKPFTVDLAEAEALIDIATTRKLLVCVGHNELYDPIWLQARQLVRDGALGDVVHVESLQGYDFSGPFGTQIRNNPQHWVHKLPGGLFHNTISHPVYKIFDCLGPCDPRIAAQWFSTPALDAPILTELRASFICGDRSASLWVSSAAKPVQRIVRIYGSRSSIEVDVEARLLHQFRATTTRGPFIPIENAVRNWLRAGADVGRGVARFARNQQHFFAGLSGLLAAFYDALSSGRESPITPAEILATTAAMDRIFVSAKAFAEEQRP